MSSCFILHSDIRVFSIPINFTSLIKIMSNEFRLIEEGHTENESIAIALLLLLPPTLVVEGIESVLWWCLSVCHSALSQLNQLMYEHKIRYGNVPFRQYLGI